MKKTNQSIKPESMLMELAPITEQAVSFTITDDKSLKEAVVLLSKLNQFNDRITEEKEKVTKPLNEALKAERARWKPTELQNTEAIEAIRSEMTRYQTNLIKERKESESSIVERIAPGKGNLTLDTAVKKIEALPSVEKEHATDAGLVQFREKKQLKITNENIIPRHFFMIDEMKLLAYLKEGNFVEGAELETIQVPVNYR